MKTLKIVALFALLLTTASHLHARAEKEATAGKYTVTFFAANGSVYRVDTTVKSTSEAGETSFVTVVNSGSGELLGTIKRSVLTAETREDKTTVFTTRNTHTDKLGNYESTTYSIIIVDENDVIVDIVETATLDDATKVGIKALNKARDFGPVTSGNF